MVRGSLLPPLGSFLRLAPSLIKLDNPLAGALQMVPVRDCYPVFPCEHPLITFDQQRFRFGVFLLPRGPRPPRAPRATPSPVTGLLFPITPPGLARESLPFGNFPLQTVARCRVARRCHRVWVFRAQRLASPRQGLRSVSLRQA